MGYVQPWLERSQSTSFYFVFDPYFLARSKFQNLCRTDSLNLKAIAKDCECEQRTVAEIEARLGQVLLLDDMPGGAPVSKKARK